jgi:hypothetical protein
VTTAHPSRTPQCSPLSPQSMPALTRSFHSRSHLPRPLPYSQMRINESRQNSAAILCAGWSCWSLSWKSSDWYDVPVSFLSPHTMSTGYEAYPNVVGIVVGLITVFVITYFLSEKIDSNATDKVPPFPPPSPPPSLMPFRLPFSVNIFQISLGIGNQSTSRSWRRTRRQLSIERSEHLCSAFDKKPVPM